MTTENRSSWQRSLPMQPDREYPTRYVRPTSERFRAGELSFQTYQTRLSTKHSASVLSALKNTLD